MDSTECKCKWRIWRNKYFEWKRKWFNDFQANTCCLRSPMKSKIWMKKTLSWYLRTSCELESMLVRRSYIFHVFRCFLVRTRQRTSGNIRRCMSLDVKNFLSLGFLLEPFSCARSLGIFNVKSKLHSIANRPSNQTSFQLTDEWDLSFLLLRQR